MVFTIIPGGNWERTPNPPAFPRGEPWNKSCRNWLCHKSEFPGLSCWAKGFRAGEACPLGTRDLGLERPVLWAPGLGQFPGARSQAWKGLPVSPAIDADTRRPAEEEGPEAPGREHSPPTYSPGRRKSHRKQERETAGAGERLAFLRWDLPWG